MTFPIPRGFSMAGVHSGIKRNPARQDITLIVGDDPLTAAGVYTRNLIHAAPVVLDRQRTPSALTRAVVANSGNANACTGQRGMEDARQMADLAATAISADPRQVLVLSTGVIGEYLPMEKITAGIQTAAGQLKSDEQSLVNAARGILTTDHSEKIVCRTIDLNGCEVRIAGIAKGAGMIGPKMATMLAVLMTDAALVPDIAQQILQEVADASFNCISVEGHMSTNDTMLLLASGKASQTPLAGAARAQFQAALLDLCIELAKMIPNDGEGAAHLITIEVQGCATRGDALQIAQTVANSALVKTAVAGCDPNWGRIVSAAGYAGVPFDPAGVGLQLNGTPLYQNGAPVPFDASVVSRSMRDQREVQIRLIFGEGTAQATFWTSDLTVEYVHINADYHT